MLRALNDSVMFLFTFVLYLRDWTVVSARNIHFHSWSHEATACFHANPCQSSCPRVCLVCQVIVHEVPGQELEVEVYDKDPDQDDFLGRYILIVCVSRVPLLNHTSSVFSGHLSWPVGKTTLPVIWILIECMLQHLRFMLWSFYPIFEYIFCYLYLIMSYAPLCRDKLDLGIVKKSIVVDDVSKKKNWYLSEYVYAVFWSLDVCLPSG